MDLISNFRKKRAIKSYIKKLPRLLAKDYGSSKSYTPMQVKKTIERNRLPVIYSGYALAIFSNQDAYNQFYQDIGETCDYDAMRCEVADKHFSGNSNFEMSDVISTSSSYGGFDGGGGFSGGDGGGGSGD